VTATPCGTCSACTDIDAGRFVDLLELDAASNRGIGEMRDILDNARYAPTVGRYKVYLIDEVHQLTKEAFNSMLKTLEEPPDHVKFVLATTDPQKIPITVLSRCLQFNLKQLSLPLIGERLTAIMAAEGVAAEPPALALIAKAAQGSMRDALSLLDQAIAYGGGDVRDDVVRSMLGTVDTGYVHRIVEALLAGDGVALLGECDAMVESSVGFAGALEARGARASHRGGPAVPQAAEGFDDGERIAAYANRFAPGVSSWQIAAQGRADLAIAPDEAMGLSMTLLRMLAFEPGTGAPSTAGAPPSRASAAPPRGERRARFPLRGGSGTDFPVGAHAVTGTDTRASEGAGVDAAARGAARGARRLAGVRREPGPHGHGARARGADRDAPARGIRADPRAPGGAPAPDGQDLRRSPQGRARAGDRTQAPARIRGRRADRRLARLAHRARARGGEGPHRGDVPRRAVRARRRHAFRRIRSQRHDQAALSQARTLPGTPTTMQKNQPA
jgi:DNA polymerase-3 subunit gamma/tau